MSRRPLFLFVFCAALSSAFIAQAQNPTFTNETATRLSGAGVSTDSSEKDYGIGDFDLDGDDDVIVGRRVGLNINTGSPLPNFLLMNQSGVLTDMTAALAPALSASQRTRDVLIDDFDNDGWLDALIADGPNVAPLLLMNQGESGGSWLGFADMSIMLPAGFNVDAWTAGSGDLLNDGDGYPDVFVGVRTGNDRILINAGDAGAGWLGFTDGSARLGANASTNAVRSVTITDLNGDGDQDIIQGVTGTGLLRMLPNNGSGMFNAAGQTFANSATYNHALGDLDGDGDLEIFAVQNGNDQYRLNNGPAAGETISLGAAVNAPGTNGFGAICRATDLDGDGLTDFLVADLDQEFPQDCSRRLQILLNDGTGPSFLFDAYPGVVGWTPNGTSDVAPIDIDGDNDIDLLIGHCGGNTVWTQDGTGVVIPRFSRGDVNNDGALDVADPVSLLAFLFSGGPAPACEDAADGIAILGALFSGTGPLPDPLMCDVDPTMDMLDCLDTTNCP